MAKPPATLKKVSVSLPFGLGKAEWESDLAERKAAWSLYVELETRIVTQSFDESHGLLLESVKSLFSLFEITRSILREAGPSVGCSSHSVGGIAIYVLNSGIRPFLTKWHVQLQEWDMNRPKEISQKQHEMNWPFENEMKKELKGLQVNLSGFSLALGKISGAIK